MPRVINLQNWNTLFAPRFSHLETFTDSDDNILNDEGSSTAYYIVPFSRIPNYLIPNTMSLVQSITSHTYMPINFCTVDPAFDSVSDTGSNEGSIGRPAAFGINQTDISIVFTSFYTRLPSQHFGYILGDTIDVNAIFRTAGEVVYAFGSVVHAILHVLDIEYKGVLKRYFIHHGLVSSFSVYDPDEDTYLLTLDVPIGNVYNDSINISRITIKNETGDTTVTVREVLSNLQLVVDLPEPAPRPGDFYILTRPILIEDPMLLTGFWLGFEDDGHRVSDVSSYNLPVTTKNIFYLKVKCTGVYILKVNDTVTVYSSAAPFEDSGDIKWCFYNMEVRSAYYRDAKKRVGMRFVYKSYDEFREGSFEDFGEEIPENILSPEYHVRNEATSSDLATLKGLPEYNDVLRIELDLLGSSATNNFYSPILEREYIFQSDYWYKILFQPDGNVIDVSISDVTGSRELSLDEDMYIFNQYAWKMDASRFTELQTNLGGKVQSISNDRAKITDIVVTRGLHANWYQTPYFDYFEDGINSYYNRIKIGVNDIPHGDYDVAYKKYQNWSFLSADYKNVFQIKNVLFDELDKWTVEFEDADISNFETSRAFILFDKGHLYKEDPVLINTTFQYLYKVRGECDSLSIDQSIVHFNRKKFIPANSSLNVGSGFLSGIEPMQRAMHPNYAYLTIQTPKTKTGICSFYDFVFKKDCVFYVDVLERCVCLRRGSLGFRDYPEKIAISYGFPVFEETVGSFPIELNTDYDRTKKIFFKRSDTGDDVRAQIIGINNSSQIYGFPVSGLGVVDFQYLRYLGIGPGELESSDLTNTELPCSPVFIYTKNKKSKHDYGELYICIPTSKEKILISSSAESSRSSPSEVNIEYINEYQILTAGSSSQFDVHILNTGIYVCIYSMSIQSINIDDKIYNSNEEENIWSISSSVFVLSSEDGGKTWLSPMIPKHVIDSADIEEKYSVPLMILSGVNYLCSFYDENNNSIICISEHIGGNGIRYLGVFIFALQNVSLFDEIKEGYHINIVDSSNTDRKFLWRPPNLDHLDYEWSDKNASFEIGNGKLDQDIVETDITFKDQFIRVLGPIDSECFIEKDGFSSINLSLISSSISLQGVYRIVYVDEIGLRMLFSSDFGFQWYLSESIFSKNAISGFFFKNTNILAVLEPNGIKVVDLGEFLMIHAYHYKGASTDDDFTPELSVEELNEEIESLLSFYAFSGSIPDQKMSGYIDDRGILYVFFYSDSGLLTGVKSVDLQNWSVIENF